MCGSDEGLADPARSLAVLELGLFIAELTLVFVSKYFERRSANDVIGNSLIRRGPASQKKVRR